MTKIFTLFAFITFLLLYFPKIGKGGPTGLNQCSPKFENHTLCHGPGSLSFIASFTDLLRHANTGYSIYQSNLWIILIHTKCHKDLEKLLCAIYAPICLKGHHFTRIYPCRQLCESVKEKCLPPMKNYGFEWPTMVNCGNFPTSKEAECIQLSDKSELLTINSRIKKQREDRSLNNTILSDEEERKRLKNCKVCHRKVSMELLTKKYCESSLVIKAKIVQIFNRPKNGISIRLHHKSKALGTRLKVKSPLSNLLTEVQCSCPLLEGKFSNFRWLLLGDMENGHFVVKFLTKWRRKHMKFRFLIKSLKNNSGSNCKSQKELLKSVYIHSNRHRYRKKKSQQIKERRNKFSNVLPFETQLFDN